MLDEVVEIKEKGNACLKEEKYEEAVVHYTCAIKLDPANYSLYSNRSLAFLKMQQYYLALEDAKECMRLKPDWAKGYFRKAEVEYQTFNFSDALLSYKIASTIKPGDINLENAIKKTKLALEKEKTSDQQIPWMGAAIGIFVGTLLIVADQTFREQQILSNPILMVFMTVGVSVVGFFLSKGTRNYLKCQRSSLLHPPVDLFQEEASTEENKNIRNKGGTKYYKSQFRQRSKKGRS